MEQKKAEAIIEAVLFAMGDSVEMSKLVHVLEMDEKEIRVIIADMNKKYEIFALPMKIEGSDGAPARVILREAV